MTGEVVYPLGRQPAILRTFSQRLNRGFNDAINGFNDDGWSPLSGDGMEDVVISTKSTKRAGDHVSSADSVLAPSGVICAKASMLLQSVPPSLLVRFLREHRSEWADYNVDAYSAASLKAGAFSFPGLKPTRFSGSQTIMPLGHTVENEEFLEVVRLEGQAVNEEQAALSKDIHLLQFCSGIDENTMGVSFQLIFAPIHELFPDDAPILPSGFRIIPLDLKTGLSSSRTLDLASNLEVGTATNHSAGTASPIDQHLRSVLTIAFQFPYEAHVQDNIAAMARQYIRSIVSAVQRVSIAITSQTGPKGGQKLLTGFPEAVTLTSWICRSYHYYLGIDLLTHQDETQEALLKMLWLHPDAILCCSLKMQPVFTFANQAGLDMLETTMVALQDITLDKMFDMSGRKELSSELDKLMEQGYACLPSGVCSSTMGRHVSYDQAVLWKVHGEDDTVHCLAFCFVNWTFV